MERSKLALDCIDFRIKHHMNQLEFAKLCGVSRPLITYVEAGRREPKYFTERKMRMAMERYENDNQ